MKETAIEWFLTEFQKQVWFEPNSELDIWIKGLIPKAKEMEKEQIIKAVYYNVSSMSHDDLPAGESYYNKTFKQQE
jgi:hypothetical protein